MTAAPIPIDVDRFTRVADLSREAAWTLLRDARTRIVVHVLSGCESNPSLERLATAVARLDAGLSRSAARIALVHVTLPKLADYGVLEYELRSGTVRLDGDVVGLEEPLGTPPEDSDRSESIDPYGSTG